MNNFQTEIDTVDTSFRANTWFITGATGLVGSAIVQKIRESDIHVIALVREKSPKHMIDFLNDLDVKLVYGDILDPDSYVSYLPTCDVVVHCAAAVQIVDKEINWKLNVEGTENICKGMKEFGLKRLIHISTAGVYGSTHEDKVSETVTPQPYGSYLKTKLAAEQLIDEIYPELQVTIIRPPFIYGDIDKDRHTYQTLIDGLPKRMLPKIWRKNPKLGFVHAEDIARLVLQVGSMRMTPSKVYNVQSIEVSLKDLYKMINNARGRNAIIIPVPYTLFYIVAFIGDLVMRIKGQDFGIRQRLRIAKHNWIFSISRARKDLDYEPQHKDPYELERLMTRFYQEKYENDLSPNIIEMMEKEREKEKLQQI